MPGNLKKIVVVESSPTTAATADSILRQGGYDVTCLDDGLTAADFAKAEQPDLIISGLGLAGMDGIELCRKLASDPLTGGIPVLLMVGPKDEVYEDKIKLSGARGTIKKPFTAAELLDNVRRFLGGSDPFRVTRIIDQESEDGPRLKKSDTVQLASQSGFAGNIPEKEQQMGAPFNLEWDALSEGESDIKESSRKINLDDSALVIDTDQYGLINPEMTKPAAKKGAAEDYSWFIEEMKREIERTKAEDSAIVNPSFEKPPLTSVPSMSYQDIGVSEDEGKYRKFLDEFKRDAGVIQPASKAATSGDEIDKLAEAISEKLARKIIEKLSSDEIRRIIASVINPQ